MTEKRFTFTQDTLVKADVFDNNEFVCCTLSVWVEQLVDLLNELNDENKKLIQFKEQVFNLIDKKLEANKELDGVDTAMYYANKQTLNELKKELRE